MSTKAEPLALVDAERGVKVERSEEAEAMRALEAALDGEPMTGDGEIEAPDAAEEAGDDGEPHASPKSVPKNTVLNEVGVRCYTCGQEVSDVKSFRILNKGAGHLRCGVCNVRVVQLSRGFGRWPIDDFAVLSEAEQRQFFNDLKGLDSAAQVRSFRCDTLERKKEEKLS